MPHVDAQPSQTEVDAIKKQLKLLGHTLPTDVIVNFLQDNSGLLTAYQHQGLSSQSSADYRNDYAPAAATRRQPTAAAEPGLATLNPRVNRPEAQAIPQLDVTWASAAPSRHLSRDGPAQVPSESRCQPIPVSLSDCRTPIIVLYFSVFSAHVRQHKMTVSL